MTIFAYTSNIYNTVDTCMLTCICTYEYTYPPYPSHGDRAGGAAPAPTAFLPWEVEEVAGLHFPASSTSENRRKHTVDRL